MTVVHISLVTPLKDGTTAPAKGVLRFTPTKRRTLSGTPDVIVLPATFKVGLTDGTADVSLEPTALDWAWRVDEYLGGVDVRTVHVSVPDISEVDYASLVPLDPSTLEPSPELQPAWIDAQNLSLAGTPELLMVGTITRDAYGAPLAADVAWPDGTMGEFAGTPSTEFPGAIDGYTITHGAAVYTQATVTRNPSGEITAKPAITLT